MADGSLATALPGLSRASVLVLLYVSGLEPWDGRISFRTTDAAYTLSLHPQSVLAGITALRQSRLLDVKPGPQKGFWSGSFLPGSAAPAAHVLRADLAAEVGARVNPPLVSRTKATGRKARRARTKKS